MPSIQRAHIKQDLLPTIVTVFTFFLHPLTANAVREPAVSLFIQLLCIFNEQDLDTFAGVLDYLVPFDKFVRNPTEQIGFDKLLTKFAPIASGDLHLSSKEDALDQLNKVLSFISSNWNMRPVICCRILFEYVLSVIFHDASVEAGFPANVYGFHSPPPPALLNCVINCFKNFHECENNLGPMLQVPAMTKLVYTILRRIIATDDSNNHIIVLHFLTLILKNKEKISSLIKDEEALFFEICEIFTSLVSAKSAVKPSPVVVAVAEGTAFTFFDDLIMNFTTTEATVLLVKLFEQQNDNPMSSSFLMMNFLAYLVAQNNQTEEIWQTVSKLVSKSPPLVGAACRYSMYLATRLFSAIFNLNPQEISESATKYLQRRTRSKNESSWDWLADHINLILETPHDLIKSLPCMWKPIAIYDNTLQQIPIPQLHVASMTYPQLHDLLEQFLRTFDDYHNFKLENERRNAFAPIISAFEMVRKLNNLPPDVHSDQHSFYKLAGNRLLTAILDRHDVVISTAAFDTLQSAVLTLGMKNSFSQQALSGWYIAVTQILLSRSSVTAETGLQAAVTTIRLGFVGSSILIPFILAVLENNQPQQLSDTAITFLASSPLFVDNIQIPPIFLDCLKAVLETTRYIYIADYLEILNTSQTNLRQRSIDLLQKIPVQQTKSSLLSAFAVLLHDELSRQVPNPEIISICFGKIVEFVEAGSKEALNLICQIVEIGEVITKEFPKEFLEFITKIVTITIKQPITDPLDRIFYFIRPASLLFIHSYPITKQSDLYKEFVNYFHEYWKAITATPVVSDQLKRQTTQLLTQLGVYIGAFPLPHSSILLHSMIASDRQMVQLFYTPNSNYLNPVENSNGRVTITAQTPIGHFKWSYRSLTDHLVDPHETPKIEFPFQTTEIATPDSQDHFADAMDSIANEYDRLYGSPIEIEQISYPSYSARTETHEILRPSTEVTNLVAGVTAAIGFVANCRPEFIKYIEPSQAYDSLVSKQQSFKQRLCIKVGILFVPRDVELSQLMLVTLDQTSDHFKEFLTGLGWFIDPQTHVGYDGSLDLKSNSQNLDALLYYCDFPNEIMYHVAPLLYTDPKDPQQVFKKKYIFNDHIQIVWCESDNEYDVQSNASQPVYVFIIVYPLQTGLFRVNTKAKKEIEPFGPLPNSVIVSKKVLPVLVRETVVGAERAILKTKNIPFPDPVEDEIERQIYDKMSRAKSSKSTTFMKLCEIHQTLG